MQLHHFHAGFTLYMCNGLSVVSDYKCDMHACTCTAYVSNYMCIQYGICCSTMTHAHLYSIHVILCVVHVHVSWCTCNCHSPLFYRLTCFNMILLMADIKGKWRRKVVNWSLMVIPLQYMPCKWITSLYNNFCYPHHVSSKQGWFQL